MVEYYEARVLFDYNPVNSDELPLRVGESIEVRVGPDILCEEGWLVGSNIRGQHGLFPANHVVDVRYPTGGTDPAPQPQDAPSQQAHDSGSKFQADYDAPTRATKSEAREGNGASGLLLSENYGDDDSAEMINERGGSNHDDSTRNLVVVQQAGSTETYIPASKPAVQADQGALATGNTLKSESQEWRGAPADIAGGDGHDSLPKGWYSATDEATGTVYYYTDDGQSSWVKPVAGVEPPIGEAPTAGAAVVVNAYSANDEPIAQRMGQTKTEESERSAAEAYQECAEIERAAIHIQAVGRAKLSRRKLAERQDQHQQQAQQQTNTDQRTQKPLRTTRKTLGGSRRTERDIDGERGLRMGAGEWATTFAESPVRSKSDPVILDKEMVRLIAALVDERLMEELHRRDAALAEIQKNVKMIAAKQAATTSSPIDGSTKLSGKGSPARSSRQLVPGMIPASNIKHVKGVLKTEKNPLSDLNRRGVEQRSISPGLSGDSKPGNSTASVTSPPHARGFSFPVYRDLDDDGTGGDLTRRNQSLSPIPRCQRNAAYSNKSLSTSPIKTSKGAGRGDDQVFVRRSVGFTYPLNDADTNREMKGGARGQQDGTGVQLASAFVAPRVHNLNENHRKRSAKHQAPEAEAAALVKRTPRGRTALNYPSWYDPQRADTSAPDSELQLEYVHGYAGETPTGAGGVVGASGRQAGRGEGAPQAATRSTNVLWLRTGEVVFPASAAVVLHNFETNRQRFFTEHDEEVTALAVHPHKDVVVSGQAGKEAIVCLFDASREIKAGRRRADGGSAAGAEVAAVEAPPVFLREMSLGKNEKRGVAALDFSADGSLVLAMAGGDGQTLNILDWRDGVRLVTARAESSLLCAYSIRFNPYLYLSGKRAEAAGLAPGEACYTLVSCGQRHVRFWKLTRAWCPRIPRESSGFGENSQGRGRGEEGEGVGGWMWSLNSKPGNFGGRGDMENMTCMAFIGETSDEPSTSVGGGARLPLARTITGTESGQIYFWEVLEEDQRPPPDDLYAKNSLLTVVGWKTCGRLLAVVPKAHDGSLTDMCYLRCDTHRGPAARSEKDSSSLSRPAAVSSSVWGNLATCGADGTLRLWAVAGDAPSPLELLMTVDVSTRGVGIGHPRSVSWDRSGTTLALGTVGNAVCLVQPGEGHTGTCRALAPHPSRPWFVTGGTDRILRLWDARSRRQLSAARLLDKICSVAFHPAGTVLAVGNGAGDFLLMNLRSPATDTARAVGEKEEEMRNLQPAGFSWDVLARKRLALPRGSCPGARSPSNVAGAPAKYTPAGGGGGGGIVPQRGERPTERGRLKNSPTRVGGARDSSGSFRVRGSRFYRANHRRGGAAVSSLPPSTGSRDKSPRHRGTPGTGMAGTTGATGMSSPAMDISALRFSPDGEVLAAACGSSIHLYLESSDSNGLGAYCRYATCTGHSATVRYFDFSIDGSVLQSNDSSRELLFWEVATGKKISNTLSVRDMDMASWSCPAGWATEGLAGGIGGGRGARGGGGWMGGGIGSGDSRGYVDLSNPSGVGGGVVAVCRSNAGDVLATSDEDNCVALVRSPAARGAKRRAIWGHSTASGISALAFLCDDHRLVSAGGKCVFVWRYVRMPRRSHTTPSQEVEQRGLAP